MMGGELEEMEDGKERGKMNEEIGKKTGNVINLLTTLEDIYTSQLLCARCVWALHTNRRTITQKEVAHN